MTELIAFFSRGEENYVNGEIRTLEKGNTEAAAGMIQKFTGADLFKIEPQRNARPELAAYPESLEPYDVIYLGYPNYWGTMPMAVFTFLEHFDFTGKTIRPFCTHEGSGMGSSAADIKKLCPGAIIGKALAIRGGRVNQSEKEIESWLK